MYAPKHGVGLLLVGGMAHPFERVCLDDVQHAQGLVGHTQHNALAIGSDVSNKKLVSGQSGAVHTVSSVEAGFTLLPIRQSAS